MPENFVLTAESEALVRSLMQTGRFASPAEVIGAGLRLLGGREAKLAALRADIAEGLASGPSEPLDIRAIADEARAVRASEQRESRG